MYISLKAWQINLISLSVTVIGALDKIRLHHISDHAAVCLLPHIRKSVASGSRPIPLFVLRHPFFAVTVDRVFHDFHITHFPCPWERLSAHKTIIAEAGRLTRNFILATAADTKASQSLSIGSVARAVWRSDARLARTVLKFFALARYFVENGGNNVSLLDPVGFAALIDDICIRNNQASLEVVSSDSASRARSGLPTEQLETRRKSFQQ